MADESKKEEEQTSDTENSQDEKNDSSQKKEEDTSQKNDNENEGKEDETETDDNSDEEVTISKKEFEKYKKKSEDFDASVKLQKILKFKEKALGDSEEQDQEDNDESSDDNNVDEASILDKAKKVAEDAASKILLGNQKEEYDTNLGDALSKFLDNNSWADTDEVVQTIAQNLKVGTSVKVEDILDSIETSALQSYPRAYKEAIAAKEKSKLLSQEQDIEIGDSGTGSSEGEKKPSVQISKQDRSIADRFFDGDIDRYLKVKAK